MAIANQMIQREVTIPAGGNYREYFIGNYIALQTCSIDRDPLFAADSGGVSVIKAGTGFPTLRKKADGTGFEPDEFRYVEFYNPSDTQSMTIEYCLSLGQINDTRLIVQGGVQVDTSGGTLDTPEAQTVGVDAFTILPANQEIKERVIQNTGDFDVWYGGADLDPANKRGTMIYSGGTAVINCWGEIWFKSVDGETTISINNTMDA